MGNSLVSSGDSVPVITLETARSHISEEEYNRIRIAFQRFKKTHLTFDDFCYHLLGGVAIPEDQQRSLFSFFSRGNDTLSFENLLCSLVGLCCVAHVQSTFIEENRQFALWGLRPPMLTLPMNDAYISFYEVMSYVTHLAVEEVMELEKVFATISDRAMCKMSRARWDECLAGCFPEKFSHRLFRVFDENGDGHIDFRELVCALSALCRGPYPSRLTCLAKLWDEDGDNKLSPHELATMYEDLLVDPSDQTVATSAGSMSAAADFASWAMDNQYVNDYYSMALEIGHICLGLRPESAQSEHSIVTSFERRTRNLRLPERNIVSSNWHKEWNSSCQQGKRAPAVDNSNIRGNKDDDGWSGKVACISMESAGLRGDLGSSEYVAVPPPLWRAWLRWHGCALAVDGQFTRKYLSGDFFDDGKSSLELYPLNILLIGYDRKKARDSEGVQQTAPWACAQVSRSMTVDELLQLCISELRLKEGEARLWLVLREKESSEEANTLLDDGERTLFQLGLGNKKINKLLLEVRDRGSGVWPEEFRASLTGNQISSITSSTYSARPGAVGLVNPGNFCYRNAAIQCLARVSPLTEFLLEEENVESMQSVSPPSNSSGHPLTAIEYAKLLKEMWTGKKKNIVPNSFNDAIRRESDLFESHEQHDCQEFVAFLLDQLHSCLTKTEPKPSSSVAGSPTLKPAVSSSTAEETDEEKADREWKEYLAREDSLVTSLFSGQLRSRLVCRSCQGTSTVFEPFSSISLPIGFDNVDLYQIIVVRRDGSIPRRFGFRLPRDSSIRQFKALVADAAGLQADSLTLQCLGKGSQLANSMEIEDSSPLSQFPSGARLYALELPPSGSQWRLATHRKLQYNHDAYLLGSTGGCIVSRFGLPLIVTCSDDVTGRELYEDVMHQMHRFLDVAPTAFSFRAMDPCEDASSGHPFSLAVVNGSGAWCGKCPEMQFCRGCVVRPDETKAHLPPNCAIAVDWLPIALYLKYNHSQELACTDDPSVAETWNRHVAPSSLEQCLHKFSCAETLDEQLQCDKCDRKTHRDKLMSIWRLPQYLIVHLKRFEYLRGENRMGKSSRTIDFPLARFDPAPFIDRKETNENGDVLQAQYDCIAIANHYGQLSSGHFVAYARDHADQWLLLNDCSVREVAEDDIDKAAAYLLFYEKK